MFARRSKFLGLVLGVSDLAVIAIAFQLAYFIRQSLPEPNFSLFYFSTGMAIGLLASILAIWWVSGAMLGVYKRLETNDSLEIIKGTLRQAVIATAGLTLWLYLLKLGDMVSRPFLAIFIVLNTFLLLVYRLAGRSLRAKVRKELAGDRFYAIVGTGPRAVEVAKVIEDGEEFGNKVLAFVRERPHAGLAQPVADTLRRTYPLYDLADLSTMLREHVVDEIIFAVSKQDLEQMEEIFLSCEEEGVKTRVLVDFFPHINSDVYLEKLRSFPLLTFTSTPENEYHLWMKRAFDVLLSAALLIVLAPLFALLAALVKLTSAGPVIFTQLRCGLNGRRFRLYKFRSMLQGADQRQHEVAHLNELDGPVFKISRDPRVTPLGRVLRRLSIDEWPQLFNILKGEMSFVGPRPPLPAEVQQYERWQRRRLRMKPGLTCLWALEGRNELDFRRWMRLDLDYIEQWSLLLDMKILFRTIPRVLSGKGAS